MLGVSSQDVESHKGFCTAESLPFSLLADEDHAVAKAFGVGSFLGMDDRVTFLIDGHGVIRKVWEKVSPGRHAGEVLEAIRALKPPAKP